MVPMRDKIQRAIILSDMMDSSRKTEKSVGIKKPVPVYANEVHNVNCEFLALFREKGLR